MNLRYNKIKFKNNWILNKITKKLIYEKKNIEIRNKIDKKDKIKMGSKLSQFQTWEQKILGEGCNKLDNFGTKIKM